MHEELKCLLYWCVTVYMHGRLSISPTVTTNRTGISAVLHLQYFVGHRELYMPLTILWKSYNIKNYCIYCIALYCIVLQGCQRIVIGVGYMLGEIEESLVL